MPTRRRWKPKWSEPCPRGKSFGGMELVQLGGLEPPTSCSTDRRSNQLSYNCILIGPQGGGETGGKLEHHFRKWKPVFRKACPRARPGGSCSNNKLSQRFGKAASRGRKTLSSNKKPGP